MGSRGCSVLLFALLIGCTHTNARNLLEMDLIVISGDQQVTYSEISQEITTNDEVCARCQDFTTKAVLYLSENKTQSEIINTLHQECSHLHYFKQQCVLLVGYYAPLFFLEITTTQPEQFCEKVNLCEVVSFNVQKYDDVCTICHQVVSEVRTKLQDPDTELEIIEILLKGCSKIETYVQECKKLVFEYGPIILANAEKFLATTDICAAIHVCKASHSRSSLREIFSSAASV